MKTVLFALGIGFITHCTMLAQSTDVIRVKGGVGGEKAVPFSSRYRYDQFLDGKIVYRNGTMASARFNYNILLGEMQFITPRGDTLAVANEPLVRLVGVGNEVFLCDQNKGYLEVITEYPSVRLAVRQGLKMARNEKIGGYGQSSGTSSITSYQSYSSQNASVSNLDGKGDLVLIKGRDYFMIDQNGRSYPMTRAGLLKVFDKQRGRLTAYLRNEPINFRQEDDLKKVLKYCSEIL